MDKELMAAIKLLQENNYIVKKFTKTMQIDADDCEASGCCKECLDCACNVCIIQ